MKSTAVLVKFPEEELIAARAEAERRELTLSELIRSCVRNGIKSTDAPVARRSTAVRVPIIRKPEDVPEIERADDIPNDHHLRCPCMACQRQKMKA